MKCAYKYISTKRSKLYTTNFAQTAIQFFNCISVYTKNPQWFNINNALRINYKFYKKIYLLNTILFGFTPGATENENFFTPALLKQVTLPALT
jgi:hypothetical protein